MIYNQNQLYKGEETDPNTPENKVGQHLKYLNYEKGTIYYRNSFYNWFFYRM